MKKLQGILQDTGMVLVIIYIVAGIFWMMFASAGSLVGFVTGALSHVFSVFGILGLAVLGAVVAFISGKHSAIGGAILAPVFVLVVLLVFKLLLMFANIGTAVVGFPFSILGFLVIAAAVFALNIWGNSGGEPVKASE